MFALKFLLMIFGVVLFGSAAGVVAYDVYAAARLRSLLEQSGGPIRHSRRPARPWRTTVTTGFGKVVKARATFRERRPKPLWVARFASLEEKT
jgi:hypothetical protein